MLAAALDAAVLTCSAANMWMRCSDWDSDWILTGCGCCGRCLEAQISQFQRIFRGALNGILVI